MATWVELHLYYIATEKCLICAESGEIYQWPSSVKLNEASSGCLSCLHEWLEFRTPASKLKPGQIHNGKPVLMLNASLAPRRRGAYECAHCGQTFYGIERLTNHRRNPNMAPSPEQIKYEEAARAVIETSNLIENAIFNQDFIACRTLGKNSHSVLTQAAPYLEDSVIFAHLQELVSVAQEIGEGGN